MTTAQVTTMDLSDIFPDQQTTQGFGPFTTAVPTGFPTFPAETSPFPLPQTTFPDLPEFQTTASPDESSDNFFICQSGQRIQKSFVSRIFLFISKARLMSIFRFVMALLTVVTEVTNPGVRDRKQPSQS